MIFDNNTLPSLRTNNVYVKRSSSVAYALSTALTIVKDSATTSVSTVLVVEVGPGAKTPVTGSINSKSTVAVFSTI